MERRDYHLPVALTVTCQVGDRSIGGYPQVFGDDLVDLGSRFGKRIEKDRGKSDWNGGWRASREGSIA